MYLYFGGTLPGHGERKTLEVSLQTEVFRLPAPSRARAALRAAGTETGEEDFGGVVKDAGLGRPRPGGVRALLESQGFLLFPGAISSDLGTGFFLHLGGKGGRWKGRQAV